MNIIKDCFDLKENTKILYDKILYSICRDH